DVRRYPLDDIPDGALARALDQTYAAEATRDARLSPVTGTGWVNIGPTPVVIPSGAAWAGRVADVAADPSDGAHWLIGAAQGGVWETHDAGATWAPRTDDQASLAMGAIAFAPGSPSVVYAGTGEAVFSNVYGGAGLLKSVDGGTHWTLLAASTFAK